MKSVRHLSIEIGPRCNLSREHDVCPAHLRTIDGEMLSVERICEVIRAALGMGFSGFVGFHFYNEPTMYQERMDAVMTAVPEARYMLWTNNPTFNDERFDWVVRSDYSDPDYKFDMRICNYVDKHVTTPCYRPMIECAIDYTGKVALCCQDWRMDASPADVSVDDPADALATWYALAQMCADGDTPEVCSTCYGSQNLDAWLHALAEVGMV